MSGLKRTVFILSQVFFCLLAYHSVPDSFAETAASPPASHNPAHDPRVPADQLAKVKAMKSPFPANEATLALGGNVFHGKGTCVNCHGAGGEGDGEQAKSFDNPPRNFTDKEWRDARSDGEIFWAIENGTAQGMVPFEGMLEDKEVWALVAYIRTLGK